MNVLVAVFASVVAIQYVVIAVYVVPRLGRMAGRGEPILRVAEIGAVAFFLGCATTHVAIAGHSTTDPGAVDGAHGWLHVFPHIR